MNRFKHHSSGMTYIEVVAAIAILAIFGTSIFFMQTYLFDRIAVSQKKLIAAMRMHHEVVDCQVDLMKQLLEQTSPKMEKKEKDFSNPSMKVTLKFFSDFKESALKEFENLHIIQAKAQENNNVYGQSSTFVYIPKIEKQ